jgi:hypothetical protein
VIEATVVLSDTFAGEIFFIEALTFNKEELDKLPEGDKEASSLFTLVVMLVVPPVAL